jgi:hypothetical protein
MFKEETKDEIDPKVAIAYFHIFNLHPYLILEILQDTIIALHEICNILQDLSNLIIQTVKWISEYCIIAVKY